MKTWVINKENKLDYIITIYFQNSESKCNNLKLNEKELKNLLHHHSTINI